ncbi:MAG: trigger factor [Geminicoccaceae bacterium]
MQVTEVSAEGLKREYKVVVSSDDIEQKIVGRLERLQTTVRMPGFRPGKAPVKLLRKQYGKSLMGEILEESVNEGSQKAIADNELKPALQPKIEVTAFDEGKDLEFDMTVEILPDVPAVDLAAISLDRPVAAVTDEAIEEAVQRYLAAQTEYEALGEPRPSADGDKLTIDFKGFIDGEAFEHGSAEDFDIVLGSGMMIPGFEDQLKGVDAGTDVTVEVTFPEDYGNQELAGKAATFEVKVKTIQAPKPVTLDDDLAKKAGFDTVDDFRAGFRTRMQQQYDQASRLRAKRALLDHLAETHSFAVPDGMVEVEFDAIWKQFDEEMKRTGQSFEAMGKSEDETKTEYRAIAERRVRLGLILSDIGTKNEIVVEANELAQAVAQQARRYPGQEKEVFEFFQNNAQAREQIRAPLFEDKVVDFILQMAKVDDRTVTPEELMRDPDEEDLVGSSEGKSGETAS